VEDEALLIAPGKTDREMAEELTMSIRTAANHG